MKLGKLLSVVALSVYAPLFAGALVGCTTDDGAASDVSDITQLSSYTADLDELNAIYPGAVPIEKLEDAWTVLVQIGEHTIPAPTHLFGDVINVIPYADNDNLTDAAGEAFARGDQEIAKVYKPGQVGLTLKNHRPAHRLLDLNNADAASMKEDFKLQDTHIGIIVGVEKAEHGHPGAITLNNPQGYENGRFGNARYSPDFLRPVVPSYASHRAEDYEANTVVHMVAFNAVSEFPGDYNGGDPLAAHTPEKLGEHVDQMVRAIGGDQSARDWFQDPANLVYCAELAFIGLSAGVIMPLNERTMVPRVGQDAWDGFVAEVALHNQGVDEFQETGEVSDPSAFVRLNQNKRVRMVRLTLPPNDLEPVAQLAPNPAVARQMLAFTPMTMSDMVEQFMRTHIPRQLLGEQLAPLQGGALAAMKPGLLEVMAMDQVPESDPRRQAVDQLFDAIVGVVSTPHASYEAFREAIAPLLEQARRVTGPRDDTGTGYFVPPSLYHVAAQGQHLGLLSMQYEGHGVHVSAVRKKPGASPEPTPTDEIPEAVSCEGACGLQAAGGCWCDSECVEYGDCCGDYEPVCAAD